MAKSKFSDGRLYSKEPNRCVSCRSDEKMHMEACEVDGVPARGWRCDDCGHFHVARKRRGRCDFCTHPDTELVAVLAADADQHVCAACHRDPRIPTRVVGMGA